MYYFHYSGYYGDEGNFDVLAELLLEKVAEHAFDFADHMLEEYRKRRPGLKF